MADVQASLTKLANRVSSRTALQIRAVALALELAIAADLVGGNLTAAGIDFDRAFDAGGFDGAIGGRHDDVFEPGGFDEDGGDHGTAGGGEDEGVAPRFLVDGILLKDSARFILGARLDADADGILDAGGDAGVDRDRPVRIDAEDRKSVV